MKKIYLLILVLGVLVIAGCGKSEDKDIKNDVEFEDNINDDEGNPIDTQMFIVKFTPEGYSPKELTISAGDTVTWVNENTIETWPASARHPTHEVYPGSSITKCGTEEENNIFDSCIGLEEGEEWSFTFDEKGSWGYHDHLNPNYFGKIIVN
jgi:plastocyanin